MHDHALPHVGLRMIKSAAAAMTAFFSSNFSMSWSRMI